MPASRRLCNYYRCSRPGSVIQRNIDHDKNGHIYHHGCLMDTQDERWRCLECFMIFDATEASFEETQILKNDEFRERYRPICPACGCHNLKKVSGRAD